MPIRGLFLSLIAVLIGYLPGSACAGHAVVLVYHHVSEQTPASTSVRPDRFEAHLDYLESHGFEVWPLSRVLAAAIQGAQDLPDNVVAITFDDAYRSVYSKAWPMLQEREWPFTVFVNTDSIDAGHSPYMSWDELRELVKNGVDIGNHSASHGHLIARLDNETLDTWQARIGDDILRARNRIADELGVVSTVFAYPYGEDSQALKALVGEHYAFAVAQRSGAVGPTTSPLSIPRFPMASGFDSQERFVLAINARPLPVTAAVPTPPGDGVRGPVDSLQLTLDEGDYLSARLACFSASGESVSIELGDKEPFQFKINVNGLGSAGRNKINCTAPASDNSGDYFWYSFQWVQEAATD